MNTLLNILSIILESFLFFRITNSMLTFDSKKGKNLYPFFCYISINSLRYFVIQYNLISSRMIPRVAALILLFLVVILFYKDSLLSKLIWYSLYYLLTMIFEVIAFLLILTILHFDTEYILSNFTTNAYCLIISKFLNLVTVEYIVRRFQHTIIVPKGFRLELASILLMDFMLIILSLLFTGKPVMLQKYRNEYITLILIVILLISGLTIMLCYRITNQANKELEYQLKMQQIELENKLNDDLSAVVHNLRSLRHDMNNHIGIIKGLSDNNDYDLLNEYINEIYSTVDDANTFIFVENQPLQILLNSKISKAKQKNIRMETEIEVNEIKISDKDMCALLGNIIDNAIEATNKMNENKYVQLTIKEKNNTCFIHCENTYAEAPVIVDGKFITSKRASLEHGIGTENIKSIVEKYNGTFDYSIDELFTLNILIPYS